MRACGSSPDHVANVSGGRVQFELSGRRARTALAKGCSLDLHPRVFGPATCAQTLLAQVPVLIAGGATPDGTEAFRVWVDVSLTHSRRAWLCDAALEYT
jgi:sarcosine oxidase subunit gamma